MSCIMVKHPEPAHHSFNRKPIKGAADDACGDDGEHASR